MGQGVLVIPICLSIVFLIVQFFQKLINTSYFPLLILLLVVVGLCEHFMPQKKINKKELNKLTDIFFIFINPMIMPVLWYVFIKMILKVEYDPYAIISGLSLPVQTLIFFLGTEFFRYWAHRLQHERPLLWSFHAVHHCMPQLYNLNQFISHPVDYFVRNVLSMMPFMFLKFDIEAVAYAQAISTFFAMYSHVNVCIKNGFWNYFFPTNEIHIWHHSTKPSDSNQNYGVGTLFWDHVFGTYMKVPEGKPDNLGLEDKTYDIKSIRSLMFRPFKDF